MSLIYFFVYMYILLKPLYIFKSGSVQPSDIMLFLAFIMLMFSNQKNKIKKCLSNNLSFVIFCLFVLVINILYFINYLKFKFILSILYFIFNLMAIIVFSIVFESDKFLNRMSILLKVNIVIQLVIFFAGLGRYFGPYRYMGTFNDPNQFSYFILLSLTLIYLINGKLKIKNSEIIITLISMFLIVQGASTGMLAGSLILLAVKLFRKFKTSKKQKLLILGAAIVIGIIFAMNWNLLTTIYKSSDNFLVTRVRDKFNRIDSSSNGPTLLEERGYDQIIKHPTYILYGAGEGLYERFQGYSNIEIHATFPSLLFYYGIIPFTFLIKWIYNKLKNNKLLNLIYILPLFIESFTLLNQRQALFWAVILFYDYLDKGELNETNIEKSTIKNE